MSCLSRKVVENRIKQQQARDDGNTNLLLGLMIVGGLLFAGHSMLTQMTNVQKSLKDFFSSLVNRNAIKQVGQEIAKDEVREIAPHIINNNERE